MADEQAFYWGTGRRKTSVARVRLFPKGKGEITINGQPYDQFFKNIKDRNFIPAPFEVTETLGKFDVKARVSGGGYSGQAGAVVLGVARAMKDYSDVYESSLREAGLLTRDSRMKERKKYGQRGARRKFQFSKR